MAERRSSNTLIPLVLVFIGVALILGAIIFILLSQSPSGLISSPPTATLAARIPFPEVARISLADARAAYEGKLATFVDVRDPVSYAQGHIPGSLNIPLDSLESQPQQPSLDPNTWIITYCT